MGTSAVPAKAPVRFGVFEFDPQAGELRRNGAKVRVEGQPVTILGLLLEDPGRLVTREELKEKLWPGETFVDFDHSINVAVKRLREALDDSADTPRYIQTLPRRGYRFIYPVSPPPAEITPALSFAGRLWILASVLTIVLGAAGWWLLRRPKPALASPVHSLAVLPLKNLSGDSSQEYFADGMTDALITEFGKVGAFRVISLQSVLRFKKTSKPVAEIARELKVDAVMEGSILRSGDKLRIDVQLVQAEPERQLWADGFVRSESDILRLQSEVAAAITRATQAATSPARMALLTARQQVDPQAYEAFLRGRELYRRFDDEWFDSAERYLRKAIELDPNYAPPYATLAEIYSTDMRYSYADLNERATAAAARALQLDDSLAEAHAAQAYVELRFRWNWAAAEREIKRALELNPNSSEAVQMYGYYLTLMGRFEEAIAAYRRAIELDPLNFLPNERLGWTLSKARRYDEAIAHLQEIARTEPHMFMGHYTLAFAYAYKHMYHEAMAHVREGQRHLGDVAQPANFDYGWVIAKSGNRQEAVDLIRAMDEYSQRRYLDPCYIAFTYAGLDDKDKAMEYFEKAYRARARFLIYIKVMHEVDDLRSDPRFRDLLRRLNFPE